VQKGVNYEVESDTVSIGKLRASAALTPGSDAEAWRKEDMDIKKR
jgi:hypothetical protein